MPILPTLHGPGRPPRPHRGPARELAAEIRETIIATVATTGGHLGSSLGVVELTIALHRLLESPRDRIVWDTGHQAYPHKLLTGRFERFGTLRQIGGVGGFPRRSESEHDVFDGGHAGTGLSIGAGPRDRPRPAPRPRADRGRRRRRGDHERAQPRGAQRHRPAQDPAADRPQRQRDVDQPDGRRPVEVPQRRSSCRRPGSRARPPTTSSSGGSRSSARRSVELSQRLRKSVVNFAQPGQLFEDLGITYIGLVPGHDLRALLSTFRQALELQGPGHRPRPDPEGPRLPAGREPTRSASTARPCRRCRRARCRRDDGSRTAATPAPAPRPPAQRRRCRPNRWPTTPRPDRGSRAEAEEPELHRASSPPS